MREETSQVATGQRLTELNNFSRKHYNITVVNKTGIASASFTSMTKGRTYPSYESIIKICENYPKINLYWLIKGEGEMWKDEEKKDLKGRVELKESLRAISALTKLIDKLEKEM